MRVNALQRDFQPGLMGRTTTLSRASFLIAPVVSALAHEEWH